MTKPESAFASSHVAWLLKWADDLIRTRSWTEADAVFQRAVALDVSPSSGIAYGCALAEHVFASEAELEDADHVSAAIDERRTASALGTQEANG